MQTKNDFIDPERNKKKKDFPINQHKPIMLVGINKEDDTIVIEYFQSEDLLKDGLKEFKKKCKSIKSYGIWASRWRSDIFELEIK